MSTRRPPASTRTRRSSTTTPSARGGVAGGRPRSRSGPLVPGAGGFGLHSRLGAVRHPRSPAARRRRATRVSRRRLIALLLLFLVLFSGLVVKLAQLQAVSPARYTGYARGQRVRAEILPAVRGAILDRRGLPLAETVTRRAIWADSALVTNGPAEARVLAELLGGDAAAYQDQLLYGGRFSYLARGVEQTVAAKVADAELPGVFLLDEPTRFTPSEGLALSVVGQTDTDNVGTAGLEAQFDSLLAGEPGRLVQEESREGNTIPSGKHRVIAARAGANLVLTLDRNLQYTVERELAASVARVRARRGVAVVLEPRSGEVMAMASVEATGDPAAGQVAPSAQNLAVTAQFEPGSVLKPVTMAAGIERGGLNESSVLDVPLEIEVSDGRFLDDVRSEPEKMTLTDVLARSSNVGTIGVAVSVGEEALDDYLNRFRFGVPTGIPLPNEATGMLPALRDWWGTSLPTLAMGQGIAVTPLQLAAAYGAIANGGEWVTPTIVKGTVEPNGRQHPLSPGSRSRIMDESTSAQLRRMLGQVVARGTGKAGAVAGYQVGGKTGTAWKAQEGGGYGGDGGRSYVASFAGMVPAEDPELVIAVMIDEPKGNFTGGAAAAPAFAAIAQPALVAMDIPPAGWAEKADAAGAGPTTTASPDAAANRVRAQPANAIPPPTTAPPSTTPSTTSSAGPSTTPTTTPTAAATATTDPAAATEPGATASTGPSAAGAGAAIAGTDPRAGPAGGAGDG